MFYPLVFPYALLNGQMNENMLEVFFKVYLWLECLTKVGNSIFFLNLRSVHNLQNWMGETTIMVTLIHVIFTIWKYS